MQKKEGKKMSFRLSNETVTILKGCAEEKGISMTGVLEELILIYGTGYLLGGVEGG